MGVVGSLLDMVRVLLSPARQRPRRVIVYGRHPPHWLVALRPEAPLWRGVAGVEAVEQVRTSFDLLLSGHRGGAQSIVIPLIEANIRKCPRLYWGLIPTRRAVRILADKGRFADYVRAQRLEVHAPRVYPDAAGAAYPCVLKRVDLSGGDGIAVAGSACELQRLLHASPWKGQPVLLQALVTGDDHVTHCLCRDGRIEWHRTYRYQLTPGTVVQTAGTVQSVHPVEETPETLALLERFLAPLGYCGPANIDTRRTADGTVVVLEINPRLGGSLMRKENAEDLRGMLAALVASARPMWRHRNRRDGSHL